MSMTKEEAIERIKEIKDSAWGYHIGGEILGIPYDEFCEIMDTVVSALRPITREQVEKVWKRCKRCAATKDEAFNPGIAHNFSVFDDAIYYCDSDYGWEGESILFCPWCGMPLTDKAVDMVMERLEEICK